MPPTGSPSLISISILDLFGQIGFVVPDHDSPIVRPARRQLAADVPNSNHQVSCYAVFSVLIRRMCETGYSSVTPEITAGVATSQTRGRFLARHAPRLLEIPPEIGEKRERSRKIAFALPGYRGRNRPASESCCGECQQRAGRFEQNLVVPVAAWNERQFAASRQIPDSKTDVHCDGQ